MNILGQQTLSTNVTALKKCGLGLNASIVSIVFVNSSTNTATVTIYSPYRGEATAASNAIAVLPLGTGTYKLPFDPVWNKDADRSVQALGTTNISATVWVA